jgi:hypothetical protein
VSGFYAYTAPFSLDCSLSRAHVYVTKTGWFALTLNGYGRVMYNLCRLFQDWPL